ncbi:MAG: GGDEF domain-containing phosphodiesterase, partial [Armatimonadota bacterium]
PFFINGNEINIGASIGICIYPKDGNDVNELIKKADTAMYKAKELGRNNYQIYHPDMDAETYEKMIMDRDLRIALRNNEFEVFYQPRIEPLSNILTGAEALIRWNHPSKGKLSAGNFIKYAEETGLIAQIGDFVLNNVCSNIKLWNDMGYGDIKITLNISDIQLRKPDTMAAIKNALEEYKIKPTSLGFEISGQSIISAPSVMMNKIKELREMGINIILEDFGTGPISLMNLKDAPVDCVKINGALLKGDSGDNWSSVSIAASIIATARNLGKEVIAVGVENEEQLETVGSLMVDSIQGHLVSSPLSLDEFSEFIKKYHIQDNDKGIWLSA